MKSTVLVKAFGLLEATARSRQDRSLADLAAEARVSKPTAHRILSTLAALGYLEKTAFGRYRQSKQIQRLLVGTNDDALLALAEPLLQCLYEKFGETVNLGILRNGRIVYLQVLESRKPLRRVVTPNSVDPFHCTALGRAIVSHLPLRQRDLLFETLSFERCTEFTITQSATLRKILARAASEGYAIERDETDVGVTCIAAPVLHRNLAVAAISISIPSPRITRRSQPELIKAVRFTAAKLSKRLVP